MEKQNIFSIWRTVNTCYEQHDTGSFHVLIRVVLHLNYLMEIAAIITGLLLNQLTIVVAAALSLLLTMILRTVIAKKKLNQFNENIPTWRVVPYEIAIMWHYISYKMMYHKADKYDFISHKL